MAADWLVRQAKEWDVVTGRRTIINELFNGITAACTSITM